MIHQVNSLPQAKRLLGQIVKLQVAALVAATRSLQDGTLDRDAFRRAVEECLEEVDKQRVAAEYTKWVFRKELMLKLLRDFASEPTIESTAIIDKIRHDINLLHSTPPTSGTLQATFEEYPHSCKKCAKNFLRRFYDDWSDGFPVELLVLLPDDINIKKDKKYSRYHFIQEFVQKNPDLYLCAMCDSSAYRTQVSQEKISTSIEHFFPRSIYPHLSCHPRNLIPICALCNTAMKGAGDPLEAEGQRRNITELILPYQNEPGISQRAYIDISMTGKRQSALPMSRVGSEHPLQIKIHPTASEPKLVTKIAAFNSLYRIEERWNQEMDRVGEQAFRRACQFLALDPSETLTAPNPTTTENYTSIQRKMKLLMAITERDNLGRDPFAFMLVWFLRCQIEAANAQASTNTLFYEALYEWGGEHIKHLEKLERLADEILSKPREQTVQDQDEG